MFWITLTSSRVFIFNFRCCCFLSTFFYQKPIVYQRTAGNPHARVWCVSIATTLLVCTSCIDIRCALRPEVILVVALLRQRNVGAKSSICATRNKDCATRFAAGESIVAEPFGPQSKTNWRTLLRCRLEFVCSFTSTFTTVPVTLGKTSGE